MALPESRVTTEIAPLATLIDNRRGNQMLDAIRRLIAAAKTLDVATGFFEVGALVDLDSHWQTLQGMRLLMGDEFTRKTKQLLVESLKDPDRNGIERAKEVDDWKALEGLEAISEALKNGMIKARVYTRAKFHAKAYHFYTGGIANHGLIGSSNFTHPGLTQNLELNLFTSDNSQLKELAEWYEQVWAESEDIKDDLLQIIQPHIRHYDPFDIYLQAMRERFFSLEPEEAGWEHTESLVYPLLAKYQQDAYHDLMHMSKTWGGGLLCDGVGLGKTFVALMLIERALKDKHKVLIIAPKATIPSVWNRNLLRFFPDDFHPDPDYQHDIKVIAHTDLGRQGGITEEKLAKLRSRYETIIVDEAHHFRVPNRNRSKKLKSLVKERRLFLLTATPVNNTILDLYNLINYVAQDRRNYFQKINVVDLRGWFGKMMSEREAEQMSLDFAALPEYHDFLRHIIVQRSRKYVKSLEKQDDQSVKFPTRQKPEVITYSLAGVYGALLPKLLKAFDRKRAELKLAIYETEKFKQRDQDDQTLLQQSQVVGLIRTMLLKRLESSQKALEASLEDLLLKHVMVMKDLQPIEHEAWAAANADVKEVLERHRDERSGAGADNEEEDDIPLTTYEVKKITQVKADIAMFGRNEPEWMKALRGDIEVLTRLVRGLHEVTKPENDAKLLAFVECVRQSPRLQKHKFVLFSEFKDTARYLETELKKHFPGDAIVEVDSGRNVKNREEVIQRFAPEYNCESPEDHAKALKDPIRILISTDVLSEGLNLQDANIIVNYDLHWNPVRLMQRIGRVDRRMDRAKPVKYEHVYVYNFLPPEELDDVLGLYKTLTGKLIAINRTLGIEAPVLSAKDDFAAMDFYQNLGESQLSIAETLRLKAHALAKQYPERWAATVSFPNRIYSGRPAPNTGSDRDLGNLPSNLNKPKPLPSVGFSVPPKGNGAKRNREEVGEPANREGGNEQSSLRTNPNAPKLFLAYRIPTGHAPDVPEPTLTYDVKWYMVDRQTRAITEDLAAIHEAIESTETTQRVITTERTERDELRGLVERKELQKIIFRSRIPMGQKSELICWMETQA